MRRASSFCCVALRARFATRREPHELSAAALLLLLLLGVGEITTAVYPYRALGTLGEMGGGS